MKQSHSGGTGDEPGEAVDSATSDVASATRDRVCERASRMSVPGRKSSDMSFDEIEVTRDDSGKPSVSLYGRALEVATEARVLRFEVSLTHTATMAHSMVTAIGRVE